MKCETKLRFTSRFFPAISLCAPCGADRAKRKVRASVRESIRRFRDESISGENPRQPFLQIIQAVTFDNTVRSKARVYKN
jgi:hypothetical protein